MGEKSAEEERAVLRSRGAEWRQICEELITITTTDTITTFIKTIPNNISPMYCTLVPVGSPIGTLFVVSHVDVELISLLVGEDVKEVITNPKLRVHVPETCFIFIPVTVEIHLPQGRRKLRETLERVEL